MRILAALLLCWALASADESVTRTVVFTTTPPEASIVQLLDGKRLEVGQAGVEMEIKVPLKGNNVSSLALEFEATSPGHKPLQFKMDTKGPDYNMDVNAPIFYTVVEHLQPDGSLSGGVDYVRAHPAFIAIAVGTLVAGVAASVYSVRYKKTQAAEKAAEIAARPDPASYLDRQVESPMAAAAPPSPPTPPAIPETESYLDHQLPPPDSEEK